MAMELTPVVVTDTVLDSTVFDSMYILDLDLLPKIIESSLTNETVIERLIKWNPTAVTHIVDKYLVGCDFDILASRNHAGLFYPLMQKLKQAPKLNVLRSCTLYDSINVIRWFHNSRGFFATRALFLNNMSKVLFESLILGNMKTLHFLLVEQWDDYGRLLSEDLITTGYTGECEEVSAFLFDVLKKPPSKKCILEMIQIGVPGWEQYVPEITPAMELAANYNPTNWKHLCTIYSEFGDVGSFNQDAVFATCIRNVDLEGLEYLTSHLHYEPDDWVDFQDIIFESREVARFILCNFTEVSKDLDWPALYRDVFAE